MFAVFVPWNNLPSSIKSVHFHNKAFFQNFSEFPPDIFYYTTTGCFHLCGNRIIINRLFLNSQPNPLRTAAARLLFILFMYAMERTIVLMVEMKPTALKVWCLQLYTHLKTHDFICNIRYSHSFEGLWKTHANLLNLLHRPCCQSQTVECEMMIFYHFVCEFSVWQKALCSTETGCSEMWYRCSNGACILKKNAKCDGFHDCLDHSDEKDCGEF